MKCPKCGFVSPIGRPKKLDDRAIARWKVKEGLSLQEIAEKFKVTRGAIQASLKRSKRKGII